MALAIMAIELDEEHLKKYNELQPIAPIPGNSLIDQIEKNREMRKLREDFIIMESGLTLTEHRAKLKAEGGESNMSEEKVWEIIRDIGLLEDETETAEEVRERFTVENVRQELGYCVYTQAELTAAAELIIRNEGL